MLKNINKLIKNEHNLITLIGMMGTGKTKFGNLVARELDYNFYDSDVLIEKKFSLTIRETYLQFMVRFFLEKLKKNKYGMLLNNLKKRMRKQSLVLVEVDLIIQIPEAYY